MIWLTGGSLLVALLMIAGLLLLVVRQGVSTFWPGAVTRFELADGRVLMGEVTVDERYHLGEGMAALMPAEEAARALEFQARAQDGQLRRRMVRTGNFDLTGSHFHWISQPDVVAEDRPPWALVVERLDWGNFYGFPRSFRVDGEVVAATPEDVWRAFEAEHGPSRQRHQQRQDLEKHDLGAMAARLRQARLDVRDAELRHGAGSAPWEAAQASLASLEQELQGGFERIGAQVAALQAENERYELVLESADGVEKVLRPAEVVRAHAPNRLGLLARLGVYASRVGEFLWDEPRYANAEGGVFPAIFGTVIMTLIMSVLVVPLGVLAALYLREYARQGPVVSAVRIAVNNLAGVPSIVFGVFGVGFFCYFVGAGIDELFYAAQLPNPKYGKGGILWASLTLALLTLPVVIVATEEALAAVPSSMREGSYACGATRWQTIRRIVLPRAAPGIMTGMILAIARGAGEVAPLMLVGAVKLAHELPIRLHDLTGSLGPLPLGPLHPDSSFMHLGFHIYDLGFQSQNSEAAKPMVYTTTLLLIGIVVTLNMLAVWARARLRRRFQGVHI